MSVFVIPGGPLDTNHMCVAAPYEQLNVCKELESEGLPPLSYVERLPDSRTKP